MISSNFNRELFPNNRWLVCAPQDYDVRYKINPWMDLSRLPNQALAQAQWQNLHHHMIRLGAWVEYVRHEDGNPDMVFAANAGLVKGNDVVLSRFRYKERQGEERHFRAWFEQNGFTVHQVSAGNFEGEGDALLAGDVLFCGWGFRSDVKAYEEVGAYLGIKELHVVKLIDPRFYHLDTCFCPLHSDVALVYPGAFDQEGLKTLERSIELISVPEDEAVHFVCNAVVLGKELILPAGCPKTYKILNERGFSTHPVELSEFIKAGGAAKCLSLRLEQR